MVKWFLLFQSEYPVYLSVRLLRCSRLYDTDTVHDAVDMGIDTDIGHIIEHWEDDFRCLDPDTRECLEECEVIRDRSLIFFCESYPRGEDVSRFISEKIHISEISFEFIDREGEYIFCFANLWEKWGSDLIDLFIGRLRREDHSDKELEWSLIIELYFLTSVEMDDLLYDEIQGMRRYHIVYW